MLAYLKPEPASENLEMWLADSIICSINHSEVADYFAMNGHSRAAIEAMLGRAEISVIDLDKELALDAAMMRPITKKAGLSIGDRCCLALARRMKLPALTGDRKWEQIAAEIGVEIQLIR